MTSRDVRSAAFARRSSSGRARARGRVVAVCLAVWAVGCHRAEPSSESGSEDSAVSVPVTAGTAGWLGPVRAAHQLADAADSPAARQLAIEAIDAALAGIDVGAGPAVRWVEQDLLARSAQLWLDSEQPSRALAACASGLELSEEVSVPAATLWMVQGKAHEQLGDKARAVESYHRALVMNQELMNRSLGEE